MRRKWRSGWACSFRSAERARISSPFFAVAMPVLLFARMRYGDKSKACRPYADRHDAAVRIKRRILHDGSSSFPLICASLRLHDVMGNMRRSRPSVELREPSVESAAPAQGRPLWHNRVPDERGRHGIRGRLRKETRGIHHAAHASLLLAGHAGISACFRCSWLRRFSSSPCFPTATRM